MHAPTIAQPTTDFGFTAGVLREVLADTKAEQPALTGRLDRAASLLVTRAIVPAPLGG